MSQKVSSLLVNFVREKKRLDLIIHFPVLLLSVDDLF